MYKVYVWTNTVNGKKYVGATRASMEERAGRNGEYYRGSPYFYSAIKKYGFDKMAVEIIADGLTQNEAAELEAATITRLGTRDPDVGYNLQDGGYSYKHKDPATRNKRISDTLKKERATSEYRALMSERMKRVWDDPVRRAALLAKRSVHQARSGRKRVPVFCVENKKTYANLTDAARDMQICVTTLSVKAKEAIDGKFTLVSRKHKQTYTFYKINVHNKESELLEASAGNAGGNQQPSL